MHEEGRPRAAFFFLAFRLCLRGDCMRRLTALMLFLVAPIAKSQQLPPLDVLLDRLYAYSAEYTATLPSLSCDESIVSQQVKKGKVKKQVRAEGTMREIRTENSDDPFREQHDFKTVNGKPVKKLFPMPYFIQGGFANLIGVGHKELTGCFDYHLSLAPDGKNAQLDIDAKTNLNSSTCRVKVLRGAHWRKIIDPETGAVLHSERRILPEIAEANDEAYFASLDYLLQQFGDRTFWLPSKFYTQDVGDKGRMYATYSSCHRYAGELRIVSDAQSEAPQTPPGKPR
jgi:hypothetical protein